jgi:hypothetical protein
MLAAAGAAHADPTGGEADAESAIELAQAARERFESDREHVVSGVHDVLRAAPGGVGENMANERVVKGAPYCAEAVHQTVQWLPDGSGGAPNRIVREHTTLLCRDGEGRTRQELQRGSSKLVYLRDPVARESWLLDTERKTARRTDSRRMGHSSVDGDACCGYGERMKEWARSITDKSRGPAGGATGVLPPHPPSAPAATTPTTAPMAPVAPMPPTPVVISRSEGGGRDVEVNVIRMRNPAGHGAADWGLPPPPVLWRAQTLAPRGAGTVTPLGVKEIEGQRAHGERTAWVIEAGKVGNEKPIQITREVWTAPDLMITLSSRDFDPRSGEVNYRLRNIKRGEPEAALMRVPVDYRLPGRPGGKASGPTGQG